MDELSFYLDVQGDKFDPAELKHRIGLEPVNISYKGEALSPIMHLEVNLWSFRVERLELDDFSEQLHDFIKKFENNIEEIKEYVQENALSLTLTAEILREQDSNPAIFIESDVLKKMAALNCYFEIDLMGGG
jgi:hypothetical protein